jgi:probable F420-dependent oxidoreductase
VKVRFALTPPGSALAAPAFAAWLAAVERSGFDGIWLSDLPLGPHGDPVVSLSFAAAATARVKLGANIVPLGRNAFLLAKQLAELDQRANGRLLLSFVPGLGHASERAALGYMEDTRGDALETIMDLSRRWWRGEEVNASCAGARFDGIALAPRPRQQPLEIWLGGKGRAALERVARVGDGWLTSVVTPAEAGRSRQFILDRAAILGRTIDSEHFGISIPYVNGTPAPDALAALRARRTDGKLDEIVADRASALSALVRAHLEQGLTKFVVRPLDACAVDGDWRADLDWLAHTLLPLQR